VKNYTGDVMNFEMAAEIAAAETGVEVVSVITDDDVAVQDSTWTAGRRGVGVTVLLEKFAGAAAEQGRPLVDVADVARTVNANGRSMGIALTSCTVPANGQPTFELGEDEIEIILDDLPFQRGENVIAFVNGLGAAR
jgi:dihydroxyacetone kinase-like protein